MSRAVFVTAACLVALASPAFSQIPDAENHFKAALEAIRRGAFEEAGARARRGLELAPDAPDAPAGHDLLGIALDGQRRFAEAEQAYRKALELNPRFIRARNDLGINLYRQGKKDASGREFARALEVDPRNFTAHYNLGIMARDAKRYAEAAQHLEAARAQSPSDAATLLALAEAYFGGGDSARALAAARQFIAVDPASPQIRFSLGALFLQRKLYAEAVEQLERARLTEPRHYEVLHNLGLAYLHLKKYSEAEDALLQALGARSDSVDTMFQLAVVYTESGHADQAIQTLVRARQLAPARPDVLLLLGRQCIREGFVDDAVEVLEECVRLDPGKVEPHLLLGEALTRNKEFTRAIAEYRKLVELEPSNPQSHVLLGRTLRYKGLRPDAEKSLRKALDLDASNPEAAYYLGLLAADQSDYASARTWFERALQKNPKHFAALYDLGAVLMKQQEFARAREILERARVLSPTSSQVYYRLARVYRQLTESERAAEALALFRKYDALEVNRRRHYPSGVLEFLEETQDLPESTRWERYRQELTRAETLKPDDANVRFMLAQVLLKLERTPEALERIDRIVSAQPHSPQVRMRVASLLTSYGCYPEALRQLEALVRQNPTEAPARFALAALYFQLNRSRQALKVLEADAATAGESAAVFSLRGRIWSREGSTEKALEDFRRAVELEPANEDHVQDLALELLAARRLQEARQLLEGARKALPTSPRVRFAEGVRNQVSGHEAEARAAFQQAADLGWRWDVPYLALGNLASRRGLAGEAREAFEQAAALDPTSPWPPVFKALFFAKAHGGEGSINRGELARALELAPRRPEVLPVLLAVALERRECSTAEQVRNKMAALGFGPDLNPACQGRESAGSKANSSEANPLGAPGDLRLLIEAARSTIASSAQGVQ